MCVLLASKMPTVLPCSLHLVSCWSKPSSMVKTMRRPSPWASALMSCQSPQSRHALSPRRSTNRVVRVNGGNLVIKPATQFGVSLLLLVPGAWSSRRHWHTGSDEFVYDGRMDVHADDVGVVRQVGCSSSTLYRQVPPQTVRPPALGDRLTTMGGRCCCRHADHLRPAPTVGCCPGLAIGESVGKRLVIEATPHGQPKQRDAWRNYLV